MRLTTRELFDVCYGQFAIAAVNVEFMEQILALFAGAAYAQAPIIVQTTPMARDYAHPQMLLAMIEAAAHIHPEVIYALHLDHGVEDHIEDALSSGGYTSVMIDASHDSFSENIRRTQAVVVRAQAKGVSVEAELGVLAGVEDDLSVDESKALYTDPGEVAEFVGKTGCDSLAIAIGTSHGAYKFSGGQGLQFHILEEIQRRIPRFPLVLHGGSSVDPEEVRRINEAGGKIEIGASGVDPDELKQAIGLGICKVNLATDFRLLWTRVNREAFRDFPERFAPIPNGETYMQAYQETLMKKFDLLGSAGQAQKFRVKA